MPNLSVAPLTCPNCNELLTEEDNTGEEMLNDEGKQVCLACFHDRFLTRFKENIAEAVAYANLPEDKNRLF